MINNANQNLLIFDEDSPLFIKQKSSIKPKKAVKIPTVNKYVLKYSVRHPDDCKHILPSFRKKLNMIWKDLESSDNMKASAVPSYIRGAAVVVEKNKRPEEYEELKVLINLAKQILDEK